MGGKSKREGRDEESKELRVGEREGSREKKN